MKIMNRLFSVLSWLVIGAIVIYMAIAAPMLLAYRPVVVLSGSMEPSYPVGSVIYYKECPFEQLETGDSVTFQAENSLVTHRITKVNEISRTVVTKGDSNTTEDPVPVEENQIVGKATDFAIPYAGYFVTYGKHPLSIALMAIILLISHVLEHFVSEPKERSENHAQENK